MYILFLLSNRFLEIFYTHCKCVYINIPYIFLHYIITLHFTIIYLKKLTWSTIPSKLDKTVGCISLCKCIIFEHLHIGGVARAIGTVL